MYTNQSSFSSRSKESSTLINNTMADRSHSGSFEVTQLSKALEQIENALAKVLNRIQELNEESQLAKTEISETFGRQFTNLHNRETQLLRQVDVVFRARGELLQKQLAHCYRLLGALETSRKWSEQLQKYSCDISVDHSQLEEIEKWAVNIPLTWNLNEESLQEAITNFGKVDMEGVLLLPSGEESKCLPGRVEEYFEEDHQVMNKPLHSNIIDIKFPKKVPKDYSYWLARPKEEETTNSSYGPYRKATDSFKPCDVQTWLGCIQSTTAAEPMEDASDGSADFSTLSETASLSSKESDSIEIVSSSENYLTADPSGKESCHFTSSKIEIENLAESLSACLKIDKQRWLLPSLTKEGRDIPLSKVCRANATCDSFDACLCDSNCYDVARKNREDKENQMKKEHSYQEWLWSDSHSSKADSGAISQLVFTFPESDYTQWLHPSTCASKKTVPTKILECPAIYADPNYAKWLHPVSIAESQTEKDAANSLYKYHNIYSATSETGFQCTPTSALCDNNIWLANSSVNNQTFTTPHNPVLAVCEALNELSQITSKPPQAQSSWTHWLIRDSL